MRTGTIQINLHSLIAVFFSAVRILDPWLRIEHPLKTDTKVHKIFQHTKISNMIIRIVSLFKKLIFRYRIPIVNLILQKGANNHRNLKFEYLILQVATARLLLQKKTTFLPEFLFPVI